MAKIADLADDKLELALAKYARATSDAADDESRRKNSLIVKQIRLELKKRGLDDSASSSRHPVLTEKKTATQKKHLSALETDFSQIVQVKARNPAPRIAQQKEQNDEVRKSENEAAQNVRDKKNAPFWYKVLSGEIDIVVPEWIGKSLFLLGLLVGFAGIGLMICVLMEFVGDWWISAIVSIVIGLIIHKLGAFLLNFAELRREKTGQGRMTIKL